MFNKPLYKKALFIGGGWYVKGGWLTGHDPGVDRQKQSGNLLECEMSHEKKNSYFPLYWLVNRDPYNGSLKSLYNWVV